MAFGGLRGTLTGNGASIGATNALTGSVAVSVRDLVFVCFGQQTNLTATGVTDNLGNTYTAQNAGTDAGGSAGRAFYSIVTVAGTLTTCTVAASASGNNYAGFVAVIEGPFNAIDKNIANASDTTSPFTCPDTGTLTYAEEVIMCWGTCGTGTTDAWAATSPNLLAGQANSSTLVKATIGYQAVTATTAVSPAFTCATAPTDDTLGTCSFFRNIKPFKQDDWHPPRGPVRTEWAIGSQMNGVTQSRLAVPAPFAETDWPNPTLRLSQMQAMLAQSLGMPAVLGVLRGQDRFYGAAGEVIAYTWPVPAGPPPRTIQIAAQPLGTADVLVTDFTTYISRSPLIRRLDALIQPQNTQPVGSALALTSAVVAQSPFFQDDWPNPLPNKYPQQTQPLGSWSELIRDTNTYIPRTPLIRWIEPLRQPQQTQPLGSALTINTIVVATAPLFTTDWPNPAFPHKPQQTQPLGSSGVLNVLIGQDVLPENQYSWPNPLLPRQPQQTQPLGSYQPALIPASPFAQDEWPNPLTPRQPQQTQLLGSPRVLNLLIGQDVLPENQYSWPNPLLPLQPIQTQPIGSPLTVTTVVVAAAPFSNTDWPNPRGPKQPDQTQPFGSSVLQAPQYLLRRGLSYNYDKPKQPVQTQPLGLPATLFPAVDTNTYAPRTPLVRRIDPIGQPDKTQPLGSNVNITTVPPTPYLMCQLDWPNPQIPRQPHQITTWNVPLAILVTIPVPEPVVDLADTHDGIKKRREHDKKRKKLIDDDRERNERRRAQIIAVFEQVIEGKVSRETNTEQVIAVAEEVVESASNVLDINTKSDAEFASLLSDLDKLTRILDDYLEADDEDVLILL